MGIYHKKLHIRKNNAIIDINLYTNLAEAGGNALHLRDGNNLIYAALGGVNNTSASPLRVRKGGTVHAVLKSVSGGTGGGEPTPPAEIVPPMRAPNLTVVSDCDYFTVPAGCRKILFAPISSPGYWWKTETVRLTWYADSKCAVVDLPGSGAQVRIINPVTDNPYAKNRVMLETSSVTEAFVQLRDIVCMYPLGHPPHSGEETTRAVWSGMGFNPQNINYSEHEWNHVKVLYAIYWGADINGLTP